MLEEIQWDYWDVMCLAFCLSCCKMNSKHICRNFEKALVSAIRNQFNNAIIIGYLFHLKHAICRHMLSKLAINHKQVKIVKEKNCFDILGVIPKQKIKDKGILCIKHAMPQIELTKEDEEK